MHCRIQCSQCPMSSWLTTYNLPHSTYHLKPTTYNLKLQPTTYQLQGGSGKLYYFLEFKFLESDRPSSSPVELPGTMLSMTFCIEWCRDQGLLSLETSKFWGSGSWVSRVSPHIQILRSWVSRVLRLSKFWGPGFSGSHCRSKYWGPGFPGSCGITQFWGPGFPESHGKKDVQGPRSIKVPDLGLSEPRISNLFGTLAQVCQGCCVLSRKKAKNQLKNR